MMLGIAIGDAFGAGSEFAFNDRSQYHEVDLENYLSHPKHKNAPGAYTDDAQMSIAVAELLASDNTFNKNNLAEYFVSCYKRDPIMGYAKGFQAFLDSVSSGKEFVDRIRPDSEKNGAAMRAVPLGIIKDLDKLVDYAKINADLTHNTPNGFSSSIAVATLSHFALYHDRMPDIESELIPHLDHTSARYLQDVSRMDILDTGLLFGHEHADSGVPCDGIKTVGAVLYLLSRFSSPKEILVESVRLGGDTDSVASISLGIKMMHSDINDLPKNLYDGLTNNKYGRDYLIALGDKLDKKFMK